MSESQKKEQTYSKAEQVYKSWHASSRFAAAIEDCAAKYARQPHQLEDAKKLTRRMIDKIVEELEAHSIFVTPEYTGSAYEGLKVNISSRKEANLEMDVMLVWELKDIDLTIMPTFLPNHVHVILNSNVNVKPSYIERILVKNRSSSRYVSYLFPSVMVNDFMENIKFCLAKMEKKNWNTTNIKSHGPAIQVDVNILYHRKMTFSVDIVPTLKLTTGEYYVHKTVNVSQQRLIEQNIRHLVWRRSFSIQEKTAIMNFGTENHNHKKLLRVLKSFRNQNRYLDPLMTYHLKNVLLNVCHRVPNVALWSDQYVGFREGLSLRHIESDQAIIAERHRDRL
ncbi:hypothetical protein HELRODRAFT_159899 [Helobdella robusta]|uniref:Uncharacterized protein n=1 Tax=Helobdella robusta TaxID=6412 RepID=T1EPI8_HELRO|nr:hypothetical protein HELRODRAFT_159899 [Helobdella robusta]ESO05823.1 hypothetical protein HELRODRAFT_159899 [Helobdella robusta]